MSLPPASITIENETDRFYGALGKAMLQWQGVETGLADIFCAVVGPPGNSGLANIAFYSVISFEAKLGMTNNVVTTRFSMAPVRGAEWGELYRRTVRRSKKRNLLAHFGMEIDGTKRAGYRVHLRPSANSLWAVEKYQYDPPTYSTCQLIAFGNAFEKLGTDLTAFWKKIRPMRRAAFP